MDIALSIIAIGFAALLCLTASIVYFERSHHEFNSYEEWLEKTRSHRSK